MRPDLRRSALLIALACAAALVCGIALLVGGSNLRVGEALAALFLQASPDTLAHTIIWQIRFPRVLLAAVTGMGLAAGGCVFQGMLRNPLADPYTLGIAGGAAFGAALATVTGLAAASIIVLPFAGFLGACISVFLVYRITRRERFSTHTLILSGVITGFVFSSLVLLLFALASPDKVYAAVTWLMGDLSAADTRLALLTTPCVISGIAVLWYFSRDLNALTLGEEKAFHLGVSTETVKKVIFFTASFITASCVAAAGVVGFVGLMTPHLMRRVVGPDHRVLLPASALAGALLLPACDTLARVIMAPVELPVGVITGFIGGIFFLVYLTRTARQTQE